jgi:hypothetical protein
VIPPLAAEHSSHLAAAPERTGSAAGDAGRLDVVAAGTWIVDRGQTAAIVIAAILQHAATM